MAKMTPQERMENIAYGKLREHRNLKWVRHWQKRIWKAGQDGR